MKVYHSGSTNITQTHIGKRWITSEVFLHNNWIIHQVSPFHGVSSPKGSYIDHWEIDQTKEWVPWNPRVPSNYRIILNAKEQNFEDVHFIRSRVLLNLTHISFIFHLLRDLSRIFDFVSLLFLEQGLVCPSIITSTPVFYVISLW